MKYEVKFTLRIDEETHKELSILAEKQQRSLNSQIIFILQKYLSDEKKQNTKKRKNGP